MGGAVGSECLSCSIEIDQASGKGVPTGIPVCRHCWLKIPEKERVWIGIAIIDRGPEGHLHQWASLVHQAIIENIKTGTGRFGEREGPAFPQEPDEE